MENTIEDRINNFIYDKPEVVVVLLQKFGYVIELQSATLPQITTLVYTALYINKDQPFTIALSKSIANDGELNFIVGAIIAIAGAIYGGITAQQEGKKNRDMQMKLTQAKLSMDEKLTEEKIRATQETERLKILSNTILSYSETLQKESTTRLKDTWVYVAGLGLGIGVLYGIHLIASK